MAGLQELLEVLQGDRQKVNQMELPKARKNLEFATNKCLKSMKTFDI